MYTKAKAMEVAPKVATERHKHMVVMYDPKAKGEACAYSVHTRASANTQLKKGCSEIACFKP